MVCGPLGAAVLLLSSDPTGISKDATTTSVVQ
jgi:hypothetical protein